MPALNIDTSAGSDPNVPQGQPDWSAPKVSQLRKQHPDYRNIVNDWTRMTLLYEGCTAMKPHASEFLRRRPREITEVYMHRLDGFTYDNILGACFGWYRAAMFKTPPTIIGSTPSQKGLFSKVVNSIAQLAARAAGVPLSNKLEEFYIAFRDDCDKKGTSLVDFFRGFWTHLALYSSTYVLIDLPRMEGDIAPSNRKQQMDAGILDSKGQPLPYLVSYSPMSVINWENDVYGNLLWAIIQINGTRSSFLEGERNVDTWYYFDRQEFRKWEYVHPANEPYAQPGEDAVATLLAFGPHSMTKQNMCPLLRFSVDSSLWLADRAYLPVCDYLNHENAYKHALEIANLAMPVINCDDDLTPQLAETGFIKLPLNAKYGWTEPEGKTFTRSEARLVQKREDIYRLLYLVYQGKRSTSSADGASAASKDQDMQPAQDVLNEYGETIMRGMQKILNIIARVREDSTVFDVRGMKFGKTINLETIQKVASILALGIPSDDFYKEIFRQTVSDVLPDANPNVIDTIYDDISKADNLYELYRPQPGGSAQADLGAIGQGTKIANMFDKPAQVRTPKKPKLGAVPEKEDVGA